jgi:hypothetical protein
MVMVDGLSGRQAEKGLNSYQKNAKKVLTKTLDYGTM